MKKPYILAHDLGTSGNKAVLVSSEGKLVGSCFSAYKTFYPAPGWAEQKQEDWWEAVIGTTRELLARFPTEAEHLAAVSFSGQMMCCSPVDKAGNPLYNGIIWSDLRADSEQARLSQIIDDDTAYRVTGTVMLANYLAAKMLWLKNTCPDVYKRADTFLQVKDYIIYKLTGVRVTDYSDATGTNLFDLRKRVWSDDIIREAGLDRGKLPDAVPSTDVVGKISREAARSTGLPEGLPVVAGGGDGPCATVGAGATEAGRCYSVYGTSAWNSITTPEPMYDRKRRTFILHHLDKNLYMSVGSMQQAGGSFEWLEGWLGGAERRLASETGLSSFDLLSLEAEKAAPGSEGALFLPYLMGERSPYWDSEVKGAFLGLNRKVGKPEMVRSVLEGTIFHLKLILEVLEENAGGIREVRCIGGGFKNRFLCRLAADIWEKDLLIMEVLDEATSLGAAIAGFIGTGVFSSFSEAERLVRESRREVPDAAAADKYKAPYTVFSESYGALSGINKKIDRYLRNNA
jgi:xylulokinase